MEMSLIIFAPCLIASSATSDFLESILMVTSKFDLIASIIGITLDSSSSDVTSCTPS